jgi:rhamnulokinase
MIAGAAEATALGSILVRYHATAGPETVEAVRELVTAVQPLCRYRPRGDPAAWDEGASRIGRT